MMKDVLQRIEENLSFLSFEEKNTLKNYADAIEVRASNLRDKQPAKHELIKKREGLLGRRAEMMTTIKVLKETFENKHALYDVYPEKFEPTPAPRVIEHNVDSKDIIRVLEFRVLEIDNAIKLIDEVLDVMV